MSPFGRVMAALPNLEALFPMAPAAPDLVTGAVLAKAKTTAALLAAGGAVMASKISILAAVVITAFFCLTAGTVLGVLLKFRAAPEDRARVVELERQLADALRRSSLPQPVTPRPGTAGARFPAPPAVAPASAGSELTARLKRYKSWTDAWAMEKKSLGDKLYDQKFELKYRLTKLRDMTRELEGIRDLIFQNPEIFLQFLRDPGNEGCIGDLVVYAFGFLVPSPEQGTLFGSKLSFETFPRGLTDGLFDLLGSGTAAQREAAMNFFEYVRDLPDVFGARWTAQLEDPDPRTQIRAARLVGRISSMSQETLTALLRAGRTSTHIEVRREVATAMNWVKLPEAQDFLLERIESATDPYEITNAALAMVSKFIAASNGGPAVDEERFVRAAMTALGRPMEDDGHLKYVIRPALYLFPAKVRPLLERARAASKTDQCRDAMTAILQKIEAGETDREELGKLLWASK